MLDDPTARRTEATIVDSEGELVINPSRYSRRAIAVAFDLIGGVDAFADWADENKSEFYTKMFTKIVGKEIELGVTEGVEALLDMLDEGVHDNAEVIDAEFEVLEPPISTKMDRSKFMAMADEYANGEPYENEE